MYLIFRACSRKECNAGVYLWQRTFSRIGFADSGKKLVQDNHEIALIRSAWWYCKQLYSVFLKTQLIYILLRLEFLHTIRHDRVDCRTSLIWGNIIGCRWGNGYRVQRLRSREHWHSASSFFRYPLSCEIRLVDCGHLQRTERIPSHLHRLLQKGESRSIQP